MNTKLKKKLSFVVPVYNEQENIGLLYSKLSDVFVRHQDRYDFEVILVNDGSKIVLGNILRHFLCKILV